MQVIPIALAIGGSILKGVSSLQAGNAAKKAADAQARDELNVMVADTERLREDGRRAIGDQLAAQWSNGFEGGTGSALDALTESQINVALDVAERRRQGVANAQSIRAEGRQRQTEGRYAAAGALLDGVGKVAGMGGDWAQARQGSSG